MSSLSFIVVDVETILDKHLRKVLQSTNINKDFENLSNREIRILIDELCDCRDSLISLREDILSDYYRQLEEYKNEDISEEMFERISKSLFKLLLGKYTSLFGYQAFRKFRHVVLNVLAEITELPISTNEIIKAQDEFKRKKVVDISKLTLPEDDTSNVLTGIQIGVILMAYYSKYKNTLLTDDEFQYLLDDKLCLIFDFKLVETTSLTGILSGIFAIEYLFKMQFSRKLADKGIYEFNLNDYNIIIDNYYHETVMLLYSYCKTLMKLKDTDNFNKTVVETFGFKVGEITMSSLVKVKYLLDYCMSKSKSLNYRLSDAIRTGNNYCINEFIINDSFLTYAEITDININEGYMKVIFLFVYTDGKFMTTSQANIYFKDIFPEYSTSDIKSLALYSTVQKIAYTGTINPDGSFVYNQPEGVQGKGFLMLPTSEELKRMIKVLNNPIGLSNAVNYVACEMVNQFYSNIFESFLNTTLFINPSEIFSLKYLLMDIPSCYGGVSDRMLYGGGKN